MPEGVFGETSKHNHVHGARVDSRAFLQDATPFLTCEHVIEQMWEHGSCSRLSESGNHVYGMLDTNVEATRAILTRSTRVCERHERRACGEKRILKPVQGDVPWIRWFRLDVACMARTATIQS